MKKNSEKSAGRRGFLKSGLRSLFLGVIACVSGLLGWREIRSSEGGNVCVIVAPCRHCSEFSGCTDPRAAESRQGDLSAPG